MRKQQHHTSTILEHGKKYTSEPRPAYWYNYKNHTIITPDGTTGKFSSMQLSSILSGIEKRMGGVKSVNLFLCAGTLLKNKPPKQYFDVSDGWVREKFEFVKTIRVTYRRNGFTVHLYGTSKWFGEETDVQAIRKAYYEVQSQLDDKFGYPNLKLYETPASTGRNLLRVSLPRDVQYERLPDDILSAVYRYCCHQGRIESFLPSQNVLEDGVYIIDGAWMYASVLSNLPTGPCEYDTRNEIDTSCPGFYYVTATVPGDWHHIGLLKEWTNEYSSDEEANYPHTPCETFESWTTGDELVLAIAHGWQITIHERYIFPHLLPDPFEAWYRKIKDLRKRASLKGDKLLKAAYRNIVLHTIGSFKQTYTSKDYTDITDADYRELEATGHRIQRFPRRKVGIISCRDTEVPLSQDMQPFVHPEWAATVWGRTRARLAEFALQLPYEDIIRLATDCVWCARKPEWVHDKQVWDEPGEFVLKDYIKGPWSWPINSSEMRSYVMKYNAQHNIGDLSLSNDEEE